MPTPVILAEQLKADLITKGIARQLGTVIPVPYLPVVVLDPRDGAPQPGTVSSTLGADLAAETATVTIRRIGQVPPEWFDEQIEQTAVQFFVRAKTSPQGEYLQRAIRGLYLNKRLYLVGTLLVEWSQLFAGVSIIGSDELSYDTVQTFVFGVRVKALAGLNYAA